MHEFPDSSEATAAPDSLDEHLLSLWREALERVASKTHPTNYEMWVQPVRLRTIDGQIIRLQAPNMWVRSWFENHFCSILLEDLEHATGVSYQVQFDPDGATEDLADDPSHSAPQAEPSRGDLPQDDLSQNGNRGVPHMVPPQGTPVPPANSANSMAATLSPSMSPGPVPTPNHPVPGLPQSQPKNQHAESKSDDDLGGAGYEFPGDDIVNIALNPRYNFDTFVSGPSNQLAYAAAHAAATSYPPKYNPVFVCGGVGLGKTHLLHAIGHHIQKNRPNARLCYISGERFMNEYVHAIRTNKMHSFRKRYREGCEVLLVDDIQFLAGKDGTQDEFFHTFNALHDSHRQIVLTADRKPHEISDIADRLRTRFAWGLLADIEPPELEVRMAILREKASAENIHMPDEVALYIATSIKSNVRELEGALIRLAAYASLSRREITLEFARESLEGSITRAPEHLSVESVLKAVAGYYNLKIADLKSPRRHKSVAGPRAIAMYLARTHTKDSYPDLGRAFGGKHHTTVISAVEKISKRFKDEPALRSEINAIENLLLR